MDRDRLFELKLDAGRPFPEVIADKLRGLIEQGNFKQGGRLPNESELARSMKVARSSVRTALQRLETLGVVEVKRGLGWYVKRTPADGAPHMAGLLAGRYRVSDLFEMRIGLEGIAASLAAVRGSEGEIEDIAKLNQQHQEADGDREELLRTDQAFHEAIIRASRNEALIEAYPRIVGELIDWRYHSYDGRGTPLRSAREHSKVVRYLRNRDPGGAWVAMNSHLQRPYDELAEIGDELLDSTHSGPGIEPSWHPRDTHG